MITVIHLRYKHPLVKRSRNKTIGTIAVDSDHCCGVVMQKRWEDYCSRNVLPINYNPCDTNVEFFIEDFINEFNEDKSNSQYFIHENVWYMNLELP
jgi:hypothetical protein